MAEPAHGVTTADALPPELPAAADGAELDGAAVPLPPEDPWQQGQDPWGNWIGAWQRHRKGFCAYC